MNQLFWDQMVLFCVIATSSVMTALLSYYLEQRFSINWIEWLNSQLVDKWMDNRAYYKTQYVSANLDNPRSTYSTRCAILCENLAFLKHWCD